MQEKKSHKKLEKNLDLANDFIVKLSEHCKTHREALFTSLVPFVTICVTQEIPCEYFFQSIYSLETELKKNRGNPLNNK